jgi:hypothetical protein
MQPALGRRRHRRINTTISLVSRGYAVGFTCVLIAAVEMRRGSARFAPVMRVHSLSWAAWLSRDTHRRPSMLISGFHRFDPLRSHPEFGP